MLSAIVEKSSASNENFIIRSGRSFPSKTSFVVSPTHRRHIQWRVLSIRGKNYWSMFRYDRSDIFARNDEQTSNHSPLYFRNCKYRAWMSVVWLCTIEFIQVWISKDSTDVLSWSSPLNETVEDEKTCSRGIVWTNLCRQFCMLFACLLALVEQSSAWAVAQLNMGLADCWSIPFAESSERTPSKLMCDSWRAALPH